jgi:hypothetical protein
MRAGEDTVVNTTLFRRGYTAYRDPRIRLTHHSPCRTPWQLMRHHFTRGRGLGRIILQGTFERGGLLDRRLLEARLLRYIPQRLRQTSRSVELWGPPDYRRLYKLAFPLVVVGAVTAWLGMWYELLRPASGKAKILLRPPKQTANGAVSVGWYPASPDW